GPSRDRTGGESASRPDAVRGVVQSVRDVAISPGYSRIQGTLSWERSYVGSRSSRATVQGSARQSVLVPPATGPTLGTTRGYARGDEEGKQWMSTKQSPADGRCADSPTSPSRERYSSASYPPPPGRRLDRTSSRGTSTW